VRWDAHDGHTIQDDRDYPQLIAEQPHEVDARIARGLQALEWKVYKIDGPSDLPSDRQTISQNKQEMMGHGVQEPVFFIWRGRGAKR
jgi:hypothetical protein